MKVIKYSIVKKDNYIIKHGNRYIDEIYYDGNYLYDSKSFNTLEEVSDYFKTKQSEYLNDQYSRCGLNEVIKVKVIIK